MFWSLTLTFPSGGDKLTKLPVTRADKPHDANKIDLYMIQGFKIGERNHPVGQWKNRSVHGVLQASFRTAS